jgi:YbbR domain-containing protein
MKRFLKALWRMLKSNWLLKIMSVFFALILWSYVLAENDPLRTREVEDVPVRYSNSEELSAKDLAILGGFSDVLSSVTVKVEAKQSELKYLNSKNVFAYADLSTINGTGEHVLDITATSTFGKVLTVTPSQITVSIDDLVTRMVPVIVETTGNVADGYYAMEPAVSAEVINISGARADVEKVVKAVCHINLNGLTSGFKESIETELLDSAGNTINNSLFTGNIPSVIVSLDVPAKKTVPINTSDLLLGQDELSSGYELAGITVEPQSVDILGEKSVLDNISTISLKPVSVSGAGSDIVTLLDYDLPDGVSLLTEGQAQVYISIKEITDVKTFENVTINIENAPKGLDASLDISSIDVSVIAGINKLKLLFKQDVIAYVDLSGLTAGDYVIPITFVLPEGFSEENVSSTIKQVTVTLSK